MKRPILAVSAAAVTAAALLLTPMAANAAIPQDWHSGECHVDVNLDSHKVVLDRSDTKYVTGSLSNPNSCPLDLPTLGYALTLKNLQHGWDTGSGVDAYGNFSFDFSNGSLGYNWTPTLGVLTPTVGYFDYVDNDQNPLSIDAKTGKIIIDNATAQQVDVRYASRTKLSVLRNKVKVRSHGRTVLVPVGNTVTVKATSTRFDYSNPYLSNPSWGVSYQPTVQIQRYVKGAWRTIKTAKANHSGAVSVQVKTKTHYKYRAISKSLWYVWPSTSKTLTK